MPANLARHEGDRPYCIVRADMIHQTVYDLRRIIFEHGHNAVFEGIRIAAADIVKNRARKGIIHHTVKLLAQKIFSAPAVAVFIGSVFPNLAHNERVGILRLYADSQSVKKFVGELVSDVEPPARSSEPQPLARDSVFARNKVDKFGRFLAHLGQSCDSPPRFVVIAPMSEFIPGVIFALLALIRAQALIFAFFIEIEAVRARMAENSVENNSDSALFRGGAEGAEILFRAENRVDNRIVAGIVAVIGICLENRVEIDAGNAQISEIRELFFNAFKIAAEEIVIENFSLFIGSPFGLFIPILVNFLTLRGFRRVSATIEAVGKI